VAVSRDPGSRTYLYLAAAGDVPFANESATETTSFDLVRGGWRWVHYRF
jgi:hypothetical protein